MGAIPMASENQGAVLRGIARLFNQGSLTGLSEGQLLRQFAAGDASAFDTLLMRHGPMVLGVCRRLLYDHCDVEDAFQATFLVLLRRAGALGEAEVLQSLAPRRRCSRRRPDPPQREPRWPRNSRAPARTSWTPNATWNGTNSGHRSMRRSAGSLRSTADRWYSVTSRAGLTRRRRGGCDARREACAGGSTERVSS